MSSFGRPALIARTSALALLLFGATLSATLEAPPAISSEPTAVQPYSGWSLELLGRYGGPSNAAASLGEFALLGVGADLEVLDVSDPGTPVSVARYAVPDTVMAVLVDGSLAYVLDASPGLRVVDFSDPPNLVSLGQLDFEPLDGGSLDRLTIAGDHLYATGTAGLMSIDVGDSQAPRWAGQNSAVGPIVDATAAGDRLYLVSRDALLRVFDISRRDFPAYLGGLVLAEDGLGAGIAVQDDLAYVVVWRFDDYATADARSPVAPIPTTARIAVVDVLDPSAPEEVGAMDLSGMLETPGRVVVDGAIGYLLAYQYGGPWSTHGNFSNVIAFDLANSREPSLLGTFGHQEDVGSDLVLSGDRLLIPEANGGVELLSLADPGAPAEIGRFDVPYVPRAMAASSGDIVIGDVGTKGVWTVDVRRPDSIRVQGRTDDLNICLSDCEVAIVGDYAYVADFNESLVVVDTRDREAPTAVAVLEEAHRAVAIDTAAGYAYIATQPTGVTSPSELVIVDARDPALPRLAGRAELPAYVSDLAYSRGFVYTVGGGGMTVTEVVDRANPAQVGTLGLGGPYWHIDVEGDYAYLVEANGAFHAVDVSVPEAPIPVGWLDKARDDSIRPNSAQDLVVGGDVAYVAHTQWIQAIDVGHPSAPFEMTWRPVPGGTVMDIAYDHARLYALNQGSGLNVYYLHRKPPDNRLWLPLLSSG
jgi:hypothetical protein